MRIALKLILVTMIPLGTVAQEEDYESEIKKLEKQLKIKELERSIAQQKEKWDAKNTPHSNSVYPMSEANYYLKEQGLMVGLLLSPLPSLRYNNGNLTQYEKGFGIMGEYLFLKESLYGGLGFNFFKSSSYDEEKLSKDSRAVIQTLNKYEDKIAPRYAYLNLGIAGRYKNEILMRIYAGAGLGKLEMEENASELGGETSPDDASMGVLHQFGIGLHHKNVFVDFKYISIYNWSDYEMNDETTKKVRGDLTSLVFALGVTF